jgi:hypothetical protein
MDKLAFYNLVMTKMGQTTRIPSLLDTGNAKIQCDLAFPLVIPAVLRDAPWKFAERRVTLTDMDNTTPIPAVMTTAGITQGLDRTDWPFRYLLPTDCIRMLEVCAQGARRSMDGNKVPFEKGLVVGTTSDLLAVYSAQGEADLIYTSDVTEKFILWDSIFVHTAAYAVAAEIAWGLTGKPDVQLKMVDNYRVMLSRANVANGNESQDRPETEGALLKGRF